MIIINSFHKQKSFALRDVDKYKYNIINDKFIDNTILNTSNV